MRPRVALDQIVEGMQLQSDDMVAYLNTKTCQVVPVGDDELSAAEVVDESSGLSDWAAEAVGIRFVFVESTTKLAKGVVLTGPIARTHRENNVSPGFFLKAGDEYVADTVPESQVVGIDTDKGWVLVSGCGHAGIVNASEQLRKIKEALKGEEKAVRLTGKLSQERDEGHPGHPYVLTAERFEVL